jgi:hypothetical protein
MKCFHRLHAALAVVLLSGCSLALAESKTPLPAERGPGWLDDYNLPSSPSLIIQSEWMQRMGKVCSERQPEYGGRFDPLFAKWKEAHLQSLAAGEKELRSIQWPAGVTPEAALAGVGDGFELDFRRAPPEKVTVECASVLSELEDKTATNK